MSLLNHQPGAKIKLQPMVNTASRSHVRRPQIKTIYCLVDRKDTYLVVQLKDVKCKDRIIAMNDEKFCEELKVDILIELKK